MGRLRKNRAPISGLPDTGATMFTVALARASRYRGLANSAPPVTQSPMAKITFIDHQGTARTVDGDIGSTVMETAIKNNIPGIEAECGGACACATCHVYVDEAWREKVGGPSPMGEDMRDCGCDVRPISGRSCQIKVSDALIGLVVSGPEGQP